jgi:LysM repeat protein
MKKYFLFSMLILAALLTITCKSKPATVELSGSTGTSQPVTQAPTSQPPITTPAASSTNQQQSATTQGGTYNRHSSGIIIDGARNYTVQRGDTLNSIARLMYQDGSYYPLIMMVSGNVSDPDIIQPQQTLTIPDLRLNMNDPAARQAINRYFLDIARIEDQRGRPGTAELIRNHTR